MATKDLLNEIKSTVTIHAAVLSGNGTTTKGLAVDVSGYESATAVVVMGDSADTLSGSLYTTVSLLASTTTADADFVEVPIVDMIGGTQGAAGEVAIINAPTEDKRVIQCGYRGGKQYLRVDCVRTGNHATGTPIGAAIVLSHARQTPAGAVAVGDALT